MRKFDPSCYDPSYLLLKEARESWDYIVSDKVVYSLDPLDVALDPAGGIAKRYLEAHVWIECQIFLQREREAYYTAIIEMSMDRGSFRQRRGPRNRAQIELSNGATDGHMAVLVDIAHGVQFPQQMSMDGIGVGSVIRLKRFDNVDGRRRNSPGEIGKPPSGFGVAHIKDRELRPLGIGKAQLGQTPHELIEGRAQTVEEISRNQPEASGRLGQMQVNAVPLILNIILGHETAGLRLVECQQFGLQAVKVFFRPSCLQIGIGQAPSWDSEIEHATIVSSST